MKPVWTIRLYEIKGVFKVVIEGADSYAEGTGETAGRAYATAERKLTVKPGFVEFYEPRDTERL